MEYVILFLIIIVYFVMLGIRWYTLIKADVKDRKNQDMMTDLKILQDGYDLYREATRNMDIEKYDEFERKIKSIENDECQKEGKKKKIIAILCEMKNSEEIYFENPSKSRVRNNTGLFMIGLLQLIFAAVAGAYVAIEKKTPNEIFIIFIALLDSYMFDKILKEKQKDDKKENKMKQNYITKVIEIMNSKKE